MQVGFAMHIHDILFWDLVIFKESAKKFLISTREGAAKRDR